MSEKAKRDRNMERRLSMIDRGEKRGRNLPHKGKEEKGKKPMNQTRGENTLYVKGKGREGRERGKEGGEREDLAQRQRGGERKHLLFLRKGERGVLSWREREKLRGEERK